ncbi:MAG: hypothetical protein AAF532_02175 [Planctomycetota bacterium]
MSKHQKFLKRSPRRYEAVTTPLRKIELEVRSLTERETGEFQEACRKYPRCEVRARYLVLTVVDPDDGRRPLFSDEDVPEILETDTVETGALFDAAAALNGLSDSDVEELEKNSGPTDADASPSA